MRDVTEREQYTTPDNLQARVALHGYATNPRWVEWLFDREVPQGGGKARILDVGCGTGAFWSANKDRVHPGWSLTLVDSSPGMIDAARRDLGDRAGYVVAEVQELPFPDDSFDVILANHMLYHVPDRPRAFGEVKRVLVSGGAFHASTNGRGHLAELAALGPELVNIGQNAEVFGLETGPAQLAPFFVDIYVERFDNGLAVPEAEPVLAYIRSSSSYQNGDDLTEERRLVEGAIARSGSFWITTRPGLISCRKP